jgi:hypothetical protein
MFLATWGNLSRAMLGGISCLIYSMDKIFKDWMKEFLETAWAFYRNNSKALKACIPDLQLNKEYSTEMNFNTACPELYRNTCTLVQHPWLLYVLARIWSKCHLWFLCIRATVEDQVTGRKWQKLGEKLHLYIHSRQNAISFCNKNERLYNSYKLCRTYLSMRTKRFIQFGWFITQRNYSFQNDSVSEQQR